MHRARCGKYLIPMPPRLSQNSSGNQRLLREARIHQHMLAGHAVGIVDGQEQRGPSDMAAVEQDLQAQLAEEGLGGGRIAVQRGLALDDDGARHDGIDADLGGPNSGASGHVSPRMPASAVV